MSMGPAPRHHPSRRAGRNGRRVRSSRGGQGPAPFPMERARLAFPQWKQRQLPVPIVRRVQPSRTSPPRPWPLRPHHRQSCASPFPRLNRAPANALSASEAESCARGREERMSVCGQDMAPRLESNERRRILRKLAADMTGRGAASCRQNAGHPPTRTKPLPSGDHGPCEAAHDALNAAARRSRAF